MLNNLLSIKALNTYYDKAHVLQNVSLKVPQKSRIAILGRNGMGKTTLLKSIMNLSPATSTGEIIFNNRNISSAETYQIAVEGIAYVPQGWQLFPSLSVEEHIILAYQPGNEGTTWTPSRVFDTFPEIAKRKKISGTKMSGGEQQILAIARALVANKKLILLDEPSEGISSLVIDRIISVCHQLSEEGVSLLIVEQNLDLALRVAQEIYVLVNGCIMLRTTPEELRNDKQMQQKYLGI